jgi:cell division protein FtsW (lipid II flippase)
MNPTRRLADPMLFWLALLLTGVGMLFIFDAGYARSLRVLHADSISVARFDVRVRLCPA